MSVSSATAAFDSGGPSPRLNTAMSQFGRQISKVIDGSISNSSLFPTRQHYRQQFQCITRDLRAEIHSIVERNERLSEQSRSKADLSESRWRQTEATVVVATYRGVFFWQCMRAVAERHIMGLQKADSFGLSRKALEEIEHLQFDLDVDSGLTLLKDAMKIVNEGFLQPQLKAWLSPPLHPVLEAFLDEMYELELTRWEADLSVWKKVLPGVEPTPDVEIPTSLPYSEYWLARDIQSGVFNEHDPRKEEGIGFFPLRVSVDSFAIVVERYLKTFFPYATIKDVLHADFLSVAATLAGLPGNSWRNSVSTQTARNFCPFGISPDNRLDAALWPAAAYGMCPGTMMFDVSGSLAQFSERVGRKPLWHQLNQNFGPSDTSGDSLLTPVTLQLHSIGYVLRHILEPKVLDRSLSNAPERIMPPGFRSPTAPREPGPYL